MALGRIGLSYDDFCALTPQQFEEVIRADLDTRDAILHDNWGRMRFHACLTMQPHVKRRLRPSELVEFPWEKEDTPKVEAEQVSREEAERRFEERLKQLENEQTD